MEHQLNTVNEESLKIFLIHKGKAKFMTNMDGTDNRLRYFRNLQVTHMYILCKVHLKLVLHALLNGNNSLFIAILKHSNRFHTRHFTSACLHYYA